MPITVEEYAAHTLDIWRTSHYRAAIDALMAEEGLDRYEALLFMVFLATNTCADHLIRLTAAREENAHHFHTYQRVMEKMEAELDELDDQSWRGAE